MATFGHGAGVVRGPDLLERNAVVTTPVDGAQPASAMGTAILAANVPATPSLEDATLGSCRTANPVAFGQPYLLHVDLLVETPACDSAEPLNCNSWRARYMTEKMARAAALGGANCALVADPAACWAVAEPLAAQFMAMDVDEILATEWGDPTSAEGAYDNAGDVLERVSVWDTLTGYAPLVLLAMRELGIPYTATDITDEQAEAIDREIDEMILSPAQILTEPYVTSLADETDPVLVELYEVANSLFVAPYTVSMQIYADGPSGYDDGYERLNPEEKRVCRKEPYDCYRNRNSAADAYSWTTKYWGNYGAHNGVGDAFRHCVWSAIMTKRANMAFAHRFGDAHEYGDKSQPARERNMDLRNNATGRFVGEAGENKKDRWLADECDDRVWNVLVWYGNGA